MYGQGRSLFGQTMLICVKKKITLWEDRESRISSLTQCTPHLIEQFLKVKQWNVWQEICQETSTAGLRQTARLTARAQAMDAATQRNGNAN